MGCVALAEGDAFLMAFHEPADAVRWALAVQQVCQACQGDVVAKLMSAPCTWHLCMQMAYQVCSGSKTGNLGTACVILQALLTAKWPEALQYHEQSCIRCLDMEELGMTLTQRAVSQCPGKSCNISDVEVYLSSTCSDLWQGTYGLSVLHRPLD